MGITKHLKENGLAERVELVEGALAQAAQGIGLIEDRRNLLLLAEGRERDFNLFGLTFVNLARVEPEIYGVTS